MPTCTFSRCCSRVTLSRVSVFRKHQAGATRRPPAPGTRYPILSRKLVGGVLWGGGRPGGKRINDRPARMHARTRVCNVWRSARTLMPAAPRSARNRSPRGKSAAVGAAQARLSGHESRHQQHDGRCQAIASSHPVGHITLQHASLVCGDLHTSSSAQCALYTN